ncbi:MAG: hypothetical protein AAGF13_05050 [Pseudomonadota bacterium]
MLSRSTMRLSSVLVWVTGILALGLIGSGVWLVAAPESAMGFFAQTLGEDAQITERAYRLLTFFWLASIAIGLRLLWHMGALFRAFSQGDTLVPAVLNHVSGAGRTLIFLVVYRFFLRPIEGLTVGLLAEPGATGSMSITVSSQDVTILLGGVLLLMLGRVLDEGSRAAEENRAFV